MASRPVPTGFEDRGPHQLGKAYQTRGNTFLSAEFLGLEAHVLVVHRLSVDPAPGGGNPVCHLAGLGHRRHQGGHVGPIGIARQPLCLLRLPLIFADQVAFPVEVMIGVDPLASVEAGARQ